MPVADRNRALAALPAQQQKQIERGLSKLEKLDPSEREQLFDRYKRFEDLTPKQKEGVRKEVRRFSTLSQDRRSAVKQELESMKNLTPSDRKKRLDSDEMRNRFNRQEREIIHNASTMLPGLM